MSLHFLLRRSLKMAMINPGYCSRILKMVIKLKLWYMMNLHILATSRELFHTRNDDFQPRVLDVEIVDPLAERLPCSEAHGVRVAISDGLPRSLRGVSAVEDHVLRGILTDRMPPYPHCPVQHLLYASLNLYAGPFSKRFRRVLVRWSMTMLAPVFFITAVRRNCSRSIKLRWKKVYPSAL